MLSATFTEPYYLGLPGLAPPPDAVTGAINLLGLDWMMDLSSDEFRRRTVQMTRDQLNVGTGSGEEALSSGMVWQRSVTDWSHGAGQKYYDDSSDRDPKRFWSSRRVNVWEEGEVTLLPTTALTMPSVSVFQRCMVVGSSLWLVQGTSVKVFDDLLWTAEASLTLSAAPAAVNGAGDRLYACLPSKLVQVTRAGGTLTQTDVLAQSFDGVTYQAGRLFVWKGPSLWEVRFNPTATLQLIEQRPTGFRWIGVRQASGNLFAAGDDGARGTVWLLTIDPDAGSGWAPAEQRLELPDGETVLSGDSYLGFLVLATSVGVRLISVSADGGLVLGTPLDVRTVGVTGFEGQGRFVWAGTSQADGQAGLVRMDLSTFTGPLTPAWASDLEAWQTRSQTPLGGAVESVTTFLDTLMFTVAGHGLAVQQTVPEVNGELSQGWVAFGTSDPKTPTDWTVLSEPLDIGAGITVLAQDESGRTGTVLTHDADGGTRKTAAGTHVQAVATMPTTRLTQTADSSPVLLRWTLRAAPTTKRATVWTLPIVIAEELDFNGTTQDRDPQADYDRLVVSVMSGALTNLRLDHLVHTVQPIEFDWRPVQRSSDGMCWQGTFVLQCLTVEGP